MCLGTKESLKARLPCRRPGKYQGEGPGKWDCGLFGTMRDVGWEVTFFFCFVWCVWNLFFSFVARVKSMFFYSFVVSVWEPLNEME